MKILFFLIFLLSCESDVSQTLKSEIFYQRNLSFTVEGVTYKGFGLLPDKIKYVIKVKHRKNLDMLIVTSCHRQDIYYPDKDEFELTYQPSPLEKIDCGVDLEAYNIEGNHAFAYFHLQESKYKVTATISCNGSVFDSTGTGLCHSKMGLYQEVKFLRTMKVANKNIVGCTLPETKDSKTFTFPSLPRGKCAYIFKDSFGDSMFKLITLGYEMILVAK